MIDHVSIPVRSLVAASAFYEAVLRPLGLEKLVQTEKTVGFVKKYPEFWLNFRAEFIPSADPGGHICLRAPSEAAVREFHAAALDGGGRDDGAPGQRLGIMTAYFGAFILDLDGNKLEAITFKSHDEA